MQEVVGDKYMYLTYYVHLVGIKRRNCLQECTKFKTSEDNVNLAEHHCVNDFGVGNLHLRILNRCNLTHRTYLLLHFRNYLQK